MLCRGRCTTLGRNPWLRSCRSGKLSKISRFPRPPSVAIGERENGLLAKALLASKAPYQHMFLLGAKEYDISEEGVHIWEFPVHHFPGPPWSPNQWYLWGHGATPQGLVKILTAGRVFRSDADVVGTPLVKLGLGLTGFGSCPAHIGLAIQACPAAAAAAVCSYQHHLRWLSRMMTTGAANGRPHLLESFCLSPSQTV